MYKCILFDLDNTLVDSEPLVREALGNCGWSGIPEISGEQLRAVSPIRLLPNPTGAVRENEFWAHYHRLASTKSRLIDSEIPRVLQELCERGVFLGVVTTNIQSIATVALQSCDILKYFEHCVIAFENCSRRKPNPDPVIRALDVLGQQPEEVLYVGDSERDALASRDAGVHFGLAGWVPGVDRTLASLVPATILRNVSDLLKLTIS
jgi:HAD superfamily hydrolase (TIGR01549 family)